MEYLPAKDFATLQKNLPAVHWLAADGSSTRLVRSKHPGELALLHRLSKFTDNAIGTALRSAKIGMSEMNLAGTLLTTLFAGGAESYKLMIIASGERSEFPNVGPTRAKTANRAIYSHGNLRPEARLFHRRVPHRGGRRGDPGAIQDLVEFGRVQISGDGFDQARGELPGHLPKVFRAI